MDANIGSVLRGRKEKLGAVAALARPRALRLEAGAPVEGKDVKTAGSSSEARDHIKKKQTIKKRLFITTRTLGARRRVRQDVTPRQE